MRLIQSLLDVLAFLGAVGGGLMLFSAFDPNASAPQQGALAAMAAALAIIPYCLASLNHRAIVRSHLKDARPTEETY